MKNKLYLHAFGLPAIVLVLIIFAELFEDSSLFPFPPALIPLIIAGGYVCYDTLVTIWRSRKITAGILVVLALIGCVYTGEYHEGAEIAFMMLLGEALEHFAVERTQLTVNLLIRNASSDAGQTIQTGEGGHAGRLADRFSVFFLPLILTIGIVVWLTTRDIRRLMSIFVIACPCSLMLSSPTAVLTCIGNAAKKNILLANGEIVEQCGNIHSVKFDRKKQLYIADNGLTLGASGDADVIFTKNSESSLPYALALTKKARTIIWENILIFAFAVNLTGILLSGLGLLGPVPGALIHNTSSICVVLNSLRLLRWEPKISQ